MRGSIKIFALRSADLTYMYKRAIIIKKKCINMDRINIRIDDNVKKEVEQALKDMGLTLSSAITVF